LSNPLHMVIELKEIKNGLPGITPIKGAELYENCVVCLSRKQHSYAGTYFKIEGDSEIDATLEWDDIYNDQLDRTYAEQTTATNFGAVCISSLLALKLTDFTIISQAVIGTGIDYWLGQKDDILFQNTARLEISGIFSNPNEVNSRFNEKIKQTSKTDYTKLLAYVSIIDFATPKAKFGMKK
jgi:hypothetical protein